MKKKRDNEKFLKEVIICEACGYYNQKFNVDRWGTCKRCNKVLDEKAKFEYEMFCRLRLWRK